MWSDSNGQIFLAACTAAALFHCHIIGTHALTALNKMLGGPVVPLTLSLLFWAVPGSLIKQPTPQSGYPFFFHVVTGLVRMRDYLQRGGQHAMDAGSVEEEMEKLRALNLRYGGMVICHLDLLSPVGPWDVLYFPLLGLRGLYVGTFSEGV